ncbi:MAG TPA: FAD-dependent oxidoreductase [Candidatus Eremiobacteraeota bacterium]|nr:MAG: hypothetical protein BWY64_03553 [bacterium ADurb.Bin363]HPZ08965.1 FAD-dependent oxidoreductase [Candidatus Eremiobacteraeota bacterium]
MKHIVILGAGPGGLGAAWRLRELSYDSWELYEGENYAGGLASSHKDEKGFTWDLGGHVQFSHYGTFDKMMDYLLGEDGWIYHERESWVWLLDRFVPYPFQNNIHRLPTEAKWECLQGLIELYKDKQQKKPADFEEWILSTLGKGIGKYFMLPYNFKVWAYKPSIMDYRWLGERVAVADLERVSKNIIFNTDDVSWGPNNRFRFPKFGGTGAIWRALAGKLPAGKIHMEHRVCRIETEKKRIHFENGKSTGYDLLITTIPLDQFIEMSDLKYDSVKDLTYSSTHVIGLGLYGKAPAHLNKKCWMYFPESNCPFYRVTVFSHYSPNNSADISKYWSLMGEVSESPCKAVESEKVVEDTIKGMINTRLIESEDYVYNTWHRRLEYGYPIPCLKRDKVLKALLPDLMKKDIYSRGRFGAWKYEVANQDHAFMQGWECVNYILYDVPELTLWYPDVVNKGHELLGKSWY